MTDYSDIRYTSTGITVYDTIDDLPLSGLSDGREAFVSATNALYIWSDSGWYNIGLINTNPSITSGGAGTYNLAIDGTATVITLTASDPEGIPLTWSYSVTSGSLGSTATVSQSDNVFTITPSTNEAHVGTFSLTFTASDGINTATDTNTFTLAFKVENSKYTSALITSVGSNAGTNSTVTDSSSNDRSLTVNGDIVSQTFSPYRSGGYSYYVDGSGSDYIKSPTHADFGFGTDDFTIECWYYPVSKAQNYPRIWHFGPYWSNSASLAFQDRHNSYSTTFALSSFSLGLVLQSTTTVSNNTWYHLAVERSGSTITLYVNGTAEDTYNIGTSAFITSSSSYVNLGNVSDGSNLSEAEANGYISDFRYVKGTAVYDGDFTPPTERLEAISNTKLLTCHLPYLKDGSSTDHSMTLTGNWTVEPFAPYDYLGYDAGTHGGSVYFDGSGDYLSIVDSSSDFTLDGDFTIDFWVNVLDSNIGGIVSNGASSFIGDATALIWSHGTQVNKLSFWAQNIQSTSLVATNTLDQNKWYFISLVRDNGVITIYQNGSSVSTYNSSSTISLSTSGMRIGAYWNGQVNAYIADFRIVKGTAVYTSNFTPPTEPLTAITNTKLLISGTDASIIDKSQTNNIITLNGNTQSSTTVTKYGSSSMYFDGTDDYISTTTNLSNFQVGSGDFTVEAWIWKSANGNKGYDGLFSLGTSGSAADGMFLEASGSRGILWYSNGGAVSLEDTATCNTSEWIHIAVARSSGVTKLFRNGVEVASTSTSYSVPTTASIFTIGTYGNNFNFNGYIEDFRFTKGLARYTEDFTPPTAALKA